MELTYLHLHQDIPELCLQISIPPSVSLLPEQVLLQGRKAGHGQSKMLLPWLPLLSGLGLPQKRALRNNLISCLSKLPTSLWIASILEMK